MIKYILLKFREKHSTNTDAIIDDYKSVIFYLRPIDYIKKIIKMVLKNGIYKHYELVETYNHLKNTVDNIDRNEYIEKILDDHILTQTKKAD